MHKFKNLSQFVRVISIPFGLYRIQLVKLFRNDLRNDYW